jgi:hypothetical protein
MLNNSKISTASPPGELTIGQLDQVTGGQGISVVVRIKAAMTVKGPDLRSIAQQDSPFETNDNLPGWSGLISGSVANAMRHSLVPFWPGHRNDPREKRQNPMQYDAQSAPRRLSDAELDSVSGGQTLIQAQANRTGKKARLTGGAELSDNQ